MFVPSREPQILIIRGSLITEAIVYLWISGTCMGNNGPALPGMPHI